MKRCSTPFTTREMRIKPTMIPLHIHQDSYNGKDSNKCWWGCGEVGVLKNCWWKCKIVQPFGKTVWQFLKRLKVEQPHEPAIPLLGTHPREMKTYVHTKTCKQMLMGSLKTSQMFID